MSNLHFDKNHSKFKNSISSVSYSLMVLCKYSKDVEMEIIQVP